ncbi:MAG: hypothetical protein WDM76_14905 [Limisphaerales bacterium]
MFAAQCGQHLDANALTLRLQPNEGISLHFNGKIPGISVSVRPVRMHFSYNAEFGALYTRSLRTSAARRHRRRRHTLHSPR